MSLRSYLMDTEMCRIPHNKIVGCASTSDKVLEIKASFVTQCKAGNLDLPYAHKVLQAPMELAIELEFAGSMLNLMPQFMHVLDISKTVNLTEKDERLKVSPPSRSLSHRRLRSREADTGLIARTC